MPRFGQNPLKTSDTTIKPPAEITVGVLNFIPEQAGFFKYQFSSLKLCLASIRANANRPFDMLVVDNGSCTEVRDFLINEMEFGRIDSLILNEHNIGKANAVSQIFHSALGDFVFYTDGDIFYHPGWLQAHLDVLNEFPNAGLIGGIPLRNQTNYKDSTKKWIEEHLDTLILDKGDLIPEEWTREFLQSVGDERFIENWIHNEDWKISRNGISAYVGASHMQFLTNRKVIDTIPFRRFTMALNTEEDQFFDRAIDNGGFLRLSTSAPYVYHMGNSISEVWLQKEYNNLVNKSDKKKNDQISSKLNGSSIERHWLWSRVPVQRWIKKIYEWSFQKISKYG